MGNPTYRLVVVGFHTKASVARTARFLARVFKERTETEILASLEHLPVLLATHLDLSEAETLRRHLQWHGAHVRLSPEKKGSADRPNRVPTQRTNRSQAPVRSGTTYRKARPGTKDRVYFP